MKNKSLLGIALAALLLLTFTACRDASKTALQSAQASLEPSAPAPVTQDSALQDTFPEVPSSPVLDMVGVLTPEDINDIAEDAVELDNLKLAQVAVVVVDDLKGMKALDYATALANKWGVGHKETNDGITILVKPKTGDTPQGKGQAAIAVGTGMEKILTNELCQRIIDEEMIPKFKQNNYGEAIEEALDKIKDILTGDKD